MHCLSIRIVRSRNIVVSAVGLAAALYIALAPTPVAAVVGVLADPFAPNSLILNVQRSAGWRFTPNALLEVTHLGLFDQDADGFTLNYPVGLWNGAGTLLANVIIPSGTGAALDSGFRYMELQSLQGVLLSPGETYTLGYWASTVAASDRVVTHDGIVELSPWITQVGAGFNTSQAPQLSMPTNPITDQGFGAEWFGPSFRFNVVPAPGGMLMLAISGLMKTTRRRRY